MATSRKSVKSARRMKNTSELGGFTIIEVVLVLAIAGLIFLMVFLALPALQRSQRDTQRRSALGGLTTHIADYQTNNNGKLPAEGKVDPVDDGAEAAYPGVWECKRTNPNAAACLISNYVNSVNATENEFIDPDGWAYGLTIVNGAKNLPNSAGRDFDHMVYVVKKAQCDGETVVDSSNARDFVVMYKLEGSGTYCQDNHG